MLNLLSIKHKLLILSGVPLLAALFFSGNMITKSYQAASNASQINSLMQLSIANSELVHELQKERGATAGYIGSNNSEVFRDKMLAQRQLTNTKRQAKRLKTEELNSIIVKLGLTQTKQKNNALLSELDSIRSKVDKQSISSAKAIGYYSSTNASLLNVVSVVAQQAKSPEVKQLGLAYYYFVQGKERAGIERAVMSNVFASNEFPLASYTRFLELILLQDTYLKEFENIATPHLIQTLEHARQGKAFAQVKQYREIAKRQNVSGNFEVDAASWFDSSTQRINGLKSVEDNIAQSLTGLAEQQYSDETNNNILNAILALVAVVTSAGLGFTIVSGINRQVNNLVTTVEYCAENSALDKQLRVQGTDEFSKISAACNLLFENFRTIIQNISESSDTLANSAQTNSVTVSQTSLALTSQKEQTYLVATAIEEMSQTINEVSDNTNDAASAANQAEELAITSEQVVGESIVKIEQVSKNVDEVHGIVAELNASSEEIKNVVNVIKAVAEQTNLLALNAAIEAARAGEQGRGFAVVADEVRTLAQRTQESTEQIENIITTFAQGTQSAFELIGKCQENATESVEQSDQITQVIKAIRESIVTIGSMATQIATASEEQVAVANEISGNVNQISSAADESAQAVDDVAKTSQKQSVLANELRALSGSFTL